MSPVPDESTHRQPPLGLCVAILIAVFATMLGWTWLGWPDPVVDFGRELYVPWQLAQGKVLYRDIAYFNGPLSPYFNALIFKIFGPSLRTLIWTNLALLALLTTLLFRLLSTTFNRSAALAGCILQLTIFSFIQLAGVGNYNFVTPYSHELTHGLLLSIAALGLLTPSPSYSGERAGVRGRAQRATTLPEPRTPLTLTLSPAYEGEGTSNAVIRLSLVGLLIGLTFLTKIEIFLALVTAISVSSVLSLFARHAQGARSLGSVRAARNVLILTAAALVPPTLAFLLLHRALPAHDALLGTLGSWQYAFDPRLAANPFYRDLMGVQDFSTHLFHAFSMFALDGIVLALLVALAIFAHTHWRTLAVAAVWLFVVIAYFAVDAQWWQTAFAGWPLLLLVIWVIQLRQFWRTRSPATLPPIVFTTFALILTAKIILNVRFSQYGFALALPATLAVIGFCFHDVRNALNRGGGGALFVQLCLPMIALVVAVHLRPYAKIFAHKPISVSSDADRFFAGDVRGIAVNRCVDQLRTLPPNATVGVVPEGAMINYLAKRVNPTMHINLMPPELLMFGEESICRSFSQHPPDYIVFNDGSNPSEYGVPSFTRYAGVLKRWIDENYEPINNATIPAYPLRILRHR